MIRPAPEPRFDAPSQQPHPLMALLHPVRGERVLDLGCGQGYWAARIAAAGTSVTGVDTDRDALAIAAELGIETRMVDARALDYDRTFDAVFTNAALHWMPPIEAVVDGAFNALRPGGRFVGEFGGHGNIASIRVALRHAFTQAGLDFAGHDPWEFPRTPAFCDMLQAAGFSISHIDTFPRLTPLPLGMEHWLDHFMGQTFAALPEDTATTIKRATIAALSGITSQGESDWVADYVRIRFSATKPDNTL